MTDQKTEEEKSKSSPPKKERRKATIGAWWKSTVVDKFTTSKGEEESVEKEAASQSGQSASSAIGENVATTSGEAKTETSQTVKEKPKRPRRKSGGNTSQTGTTSATEAKGTKPSPRRSSGRRKATTDSSAQTTSRTAEEEKSAVQDSRQEPAGSRDGVDGSGVGQDVETAVNGAEVEAEKTVEGEAAEGKTVEEPQDAAEASEKETGGESGQSVKARQEPKKQRTRQKPKKQAKQESKPDETPQEVEQDEKAEPKPVTKLLINAEEPEECRLALLENGQLESIHVATSTHVQTKNNIYKARIVAIEPNLQAAFVDYGTEKNGFLPFSEIHPEYYKENVSDKVQRLIDQHQWRKLNITDVMERGREVLVQVVKEEVGKKGANMTTYLSLPGRCVVLMPGSDSKGISRKISGEERRNKLRDHILSLKIPEGIGWILRTASVDITKAALGRDVNYLLRLWEEVKKKGQELEGVGLIYQDHDHVLRFLRENFDPDLHEILVDDKDAFEQVKGFIEMLPSKQRSVKCKLHRGTRPIFNQYSIEDQIESIYQPKVNLPSGGSIVIDPTEALVAIDVNSGSTGKGQNFEETIYQANMEAAKELARQLRLRDLGGLIVVDFIDMRSKKNIRDVERQVKTAMKRDKAKVDISRISKFGLMQISRQKLGAPIEAGNYRVCSNCKGRGIVRSVETLALYYLRRIHTAASRKMVRQIECRFPLDVANYLLNNKRQEIRDLETKYGTEVVVYADPLFKPADNEIISHKLEKETQEKKRS